jgi:hypothetical protein
MGLSDLKCVICQDPAQMQPFRFDMTTELLELPVCQQHTWHRVIDTWFYRRHRDRTVCPWCGNSNRTQMSLKEVYYIYERFKCFKCRKYFGIIDRADGSMDIIRFDDKTYEFEGEKK